MVRLPLQRGLRRPARMRRGRRELRGRQRHRLARPRRTVLGARERVPGQRDRRRGTVRAVLLSGTTERIAIEFVSIMCNGRCNRIETGNSQNSTKYKEQSPPYCIFSTIDHQCIQCHWMTLNSQKISSGQFMSCLPVPER